tara:strand:+ start:7131 stop:8093 length:963 start_codon:yes stop_codon:yes gene_type:complete
MIFLVVFGHLIEPIINQSEVIKNIYKSIYSIHMPIFIILAGAFTKLDISEGGIQKNLKTLIVPFLAFTFLYEIFNIITFKSISDYSLSWQPYWILWFLFSMFIWKVTLPIIMQFRFPFLLSLIVSLCAGYISDVGYFLGVSRTIYFFPFFILGYKIGSTFLSNAFLLKIPRAFYFVILLVNILIFWVLSDLPYQSLYGSFAYEKLGNVEWFTFLRRAIFYSISIISSVALLMLVPNWDSTLSKRGQNSLYIYVWHGFFVKTLMWFGVIHTLSDISNAVALFTLFAVAIIITYLLSCDFVASLTNRFLLMPTQRLLLIKNS